MSARTDREPAEIRLGNDARKALARLRRWEKRLATAQDEIDAAQADLATLHRKACERFDRDLPQDALLLDVLEMIDIEEGNRWLWRGTRNNKGLATVRHHPSKARSYELSVVRYLGIALGVINEDDEGTLHPVNGDVEDVNPWHRKLRRSEKPVGNPTRYTWGSAS